MEPSYKLEEFEGPLDLLLSLISKNKIDINDIPISLLCDQYMDYLAQAKAFDIELSSSFIVMASELMLIKSRILLPRTQEEEDPRAALAAAMLEYQRAKEASTKLGVMFSQFGLRMGKDTDEISVDKSYVCDHDVSLLCKAYNRVISEIKISDTEAKKKFEPILAAKNTVSISDIVGTLTSTLITKRRMSLGGYFRSASSREELIVMFMAMLELLKTGILNLENAAYSEDGIIDAMDDVQIVLPTEADEAQLHSVTENIM